MPTKSLALIYPPIPISTSKENLIAFPREIGYVPNLTFVSLASYIKAKRPSAKVFIFDGEKLDLDQIFLELECYRPQVVGIAPNFVIYPSALQIARFAKGIGSQVILGGHFASSVAREIILNRGPRSNDHCVDAVVVQDGEEALLEIISDKPFSQVPNLVYQSQSNIKFNDIKALDLNRLPFPDFSLAAESTSVPKFKYLTVFSRKGCRWRTEKGACLFCSLMHKDFRLKTPLRFYQEIDVMINQYRPEFFFDISDDFLDDFDWFNEFHRLYKNHSPKPKIQCYSRVDNFTPQIVPKLKDIGVHRIIFGVESNDNEMLKTFRKGYSEQKNREAVELLNGSGISARINFVIGGLNESRQSVKRTLEFAKWTKKTLKKQVFFYPSVLDPFPGSSAFLLLNKKTGGKYLDRDILNYHQLKEDWLKYFCRISHKEALKFIAEIKNLNRQ